MKRSKPLKSGKPLTRGKGLARGKAPERRTRIAPVSPKRAAEADEREAVRQRTFDRDGRKCVARDFVPSVRCWPGLECDELQGRGREPGSHLDDTRTQTLCPLCHRLKTDHPRVAGLLGLYGIEERDRRRAEEPNGLVWAVVEWARLKSVAAGQPVSGGDLAAVLRFEAR